MSQVDETDEVEDSKVEIVFGARVLRGNRTLNSSQKLNQLGGSFQKGRFKKPSDVNMNPKLQQESISESNLKLLNDDDYLANVNKETLHSNYRTNKNMSHFGDDDLNKTMRSKSERKTEQALSISSRQSKRNTKLPPIKNTRGQPKNQGSQRQVRLPKVEDMSTNEYEKLIMNVTVAIISNNKYMYDTYVPTLKILANKDNRLPISA